MQDTCRAQSALKWYGVYITVGESESSRMVDARPSIRDTLYEEDQKILSGYDYVVYAIYCGIY